jgi:hypothetical protein
MIFPEWNSSKRRKSRGIQQAAEKPVFEVLNVIPAEAGIQYFLAFLDSRLRGSDGSMTFFSSLIRKYRKEN